MKRKGWVAHVVMLIVLTSLLGFSLGGCGGGGTPTALPTDTSTPSPVVPTATPIPPTPTPTASPTQIPTPVRVPTELRYVLSIVDPVNRTAHVRLTVSGLSSNQLTLTFWTNAGQWHGSWADPLMYISNVQAHSPSGERLTTTIADDGISWTGEGIRVQTEGQAEVTVEYDVTFGFLDRNFHGDRPQYMAGYMNASFALAEPEFIFCAPNDVESRDYSMTISFDLPDDWTTATHWQRIEDHTYRVNARRKSFADGAIVLGHIQVAEELIAQTTVRVAGYNMSPSAFATASENTFALYRYYTETFGISPTQGFIVVYLSDPMEVYVVPYNEQTGGFFMRYVPLLELFWSNSIAHPMCHNWNGGQDMHGVQWFQEGFTNYYEVKSTRVLDIYPEATINAELARRLGRYETEILGTQNDLSLEQAADIYNRDHGFPYNFIVYEKGSLVAYLLDLLVSQETGGQRNLDDVMQYLWAHYGPSTRAKIGWKAVRDAVESTIGQDYQWFFEAYVLGNEPLPLLASGGEVVLDEERLP